MYTTSDRSESEMNWKRGLFVASFVMLILSSILSIVALVSGGGFEVFFLLAISGFMLGASYEESKYEYDYYEEDEN